MSPRSRRELVAVVALAAVVRAVYVAWMGLPVFDPWRHLLLVDNLRAGRGFTLFADQAYLWYQPVWHRLCAALPAAIGAAWVAGTFSAAAVALLYLALRSGSGVADDTRAALPAALFLALASPVVVQTCHYGPEAFALALTLGAWWWLRARRDMLAAVGAGALFGFAVISRMNFAFDGVLFLPWLRTRGRFAGFAAGGALPVVLAWWRNRRIIAAHDWVFTWDGLATRTADFDLLSTLLLQRHPAIAAALRRLHEQIVPAPEWIVDPAGLRWDRIVFMVAGLAAVVCSRSWTLIVGSAALLGYFLAFEPTLSGNFFRLYLPLFPLMAVGFGLSLARLLRRGPAARRLAVAWLVLPLLVVAPGLRPLRMVPLEMVTAPPSVLGDARRLLVNSGFFQPESLIYRYPDRAFTGLPLHASDLEAFLAGRPEWDAILWQQFSVQDELLPSLEAAGWRVVATEPNAYGRRYRVLRPGPVVPAAP